MKEQKWIGWAVATTLIFGGGLLGCGMDERPPQKKQDGIPMVVTDKIPEEPDGAQDSDATQSQNTAQDSDATQSQNTAQDSDADSDEAKFLRDVIYEE